LLLGGFRNAYDLAFNSDGELFTFDSDMEWDWGTPWYRPTRVNHCVLGGEYGWRSGTAKWPDYYADSLSTTVDIGIGSPTGVKFGTDAGFPVKYRRALFIQDWSYGRILAVHLEPLGATYNGTFENFIAPKSLTQEGSRTPLNVSDLEFGKDGAMYFITGGRGTLSGLYRVRYTGPDALPATTPLPDMDHPTAAAARDLRHKLEAFHGRQDTAAIDFAWPHLNSDDRWIRYAARIAIESQNLPLWRERALSESRPTAALTALFALARVGGPETQPALLGRLQAFPMAGLSEEQKLAKLRLIQLSFLRQGAPSRELRQLAISKLSPLYPAESEPVNRELCRLLVFLEAPDVVPRTLSLIARAPTQEDQLHYILHLRNLKNGWSLEERRQFFSWFNQDHSTLKHAHELVQWFRDVRRNYTDGASFSKYLVNIRQEAIKTLSEEERAKLAPVLSGETTVAISTAPQRAFVREWTVEALLPALDEVSGGRSFARGRQAFTDAQCLACHRFGNLGGSVGPDLTAVASRFTRRDLLESIIDPSRVVSEQFQNTTVITRDGDRISGRLVDEDDRRIALLTNPYTVDRTEVLKSNIKERGHSEISPMPEGLVNILAREEILDLLAYLESDGDPQHAAFAPASR
jgi:putative heme-binding domain-containing protein